MASLLDKTRASTLYVLPAQLVTKLLGLLYAVLLARVLTVDDYGIYNFIVGALLIFSYFCNFGLASSLQRFLPEYSAFKQHARIINTILVAHGFRIILSLLILVGALVFFSCWAGFFSIADRQEEFTAFALGAFFLYQIEYFQIELNALFMHKATSLIQVVYTVVKFVLVLIVLQSGLKLTGVLLAEAVSYIAGSGLLLYVFMTYIFPRKTEDESSESTSFEAKRMLHYSSINALVAPGGILYSSSMDYFVIAAMANPYDLGIYALASRASKMLTSLMPQSLLQSIIRPAFYQRYYSVPNRNEELKLMFSTLVSLIAAILIPTLVIVGLSAAPLISAVFGEKYTGASGIFVMLLVFNVFTVLELPSDLVLQAIEKVIIRLYAQVFAVYNLIAAIILMKYVGIIGVAFATASALMCKCLFFYFMANRYTGISIPWGSLSRIAINSALAGGVTYAVLGLGSSPLYLVGALLAGGIIYIGLTLVNNFMGVRERKLVNTFCKRRLFNV